MKKATARHDIRGTEESVDVIREQQRRLFISLHKREGTPVGESAGSRKMRKKIQLLFTLVLDLPLVFHTGNPFRSHL